MRWTLKPNPTPQKVTHLAKELGVDRVVATLLVQRGIESFEEAKYFFRPELSDLHDPFLMKDMDKAVIRIQKAIDDEENILIYGDYDVDGTTSVALLSSYLLTYYANITTYIPDRYEEGYGVSYQGIDFAEDNGITLIIALDCGIKAIEKVEYANQKGIDFIICDHHRPGKEIPNAAAVLDPKREDCAYPYKELCGCGVGFKLIQALSRERGLEIDDLLLYLDLVATAIAADIVPMTGENRILAYYGLQVINTNPRPGIKALLQQLNKPVLTITDVVFIIAPRINAAGRMKHGNHAVTLLIENNSDLANEYAALINEFNRERKEIDQRTTVEALEQIEKNKEQERYTTVVYDEHWNKGVIGIVASRLIETYYRPTIVFTKGGDKLAASARSVRGFDVYKALEACSEHIEQFGGHKYAAGLTLYEKDLAAFKEQFEKVVSESIDPALLHPEIMIDIQLDLNEITPKFYRVLKQLAPFGPGNMSPVFMTEGVQDTGYGKCVGEEKDHLRIMATQDGIGPFVGIGFGLGEKLDLIKNNSPFKIAYSIDENHWNGVTSLQLKLKDIKE